MKNKEKYKEKLLEIVCSGAAFAVKKETLEPTRCNRNHIECKTCIFNDRFTTCEQGRKMWCEAEYKETEIDWNKVPNDTPILVRNNSQEEWHRRYFAKILKTDRPDYIFFWEGKIIPDADHIFAWDNGGTSWSSTSYSVWTEAKLANEEDRIRYQK